MELSSIHVYPVEILKSIYLIENDINNKKYVGQSINPEERFKSHCKKSSNTLISQAIHKYGKEHFKYTILEENIPNYNEKERYWIQKLNTIAPNGYNIAEGGEDPPIMKGEDSPSCTINNLTLKEIQDDLINTQISYLDLAKKYNVSKRTILRINQGEQRRDNNLSYPLRKNPNINGKLTKEQVLEIIDLLQHSYLFNGDIARLYGVECHIISQINTGESHKMENIAYPIREWKSCGERSPVTYEEVTEIYNLLQNSNMSFRKIADRYKVKLNLIIGINSGKYKKYKRKNLYYPIRKK